MKYNLFLDDIRQPENAGHYMPTSVNRLYYTEKWEVVRNYNQFILCVNKKGLPDIVSFDHDLADIHYANNKESFAYNEKTGLDCAKWLIGYIMDKKLATPRVIVHSQNPIGKKNIEELFKNFSKHSS